MLLQFGAGLFLRNLYNLPTALRYGNVATYRHLVATGYPRSFLHWTEGRNILIDSKGSLPVP